MTCKCFALEHFEGRHSMYDIPPLFSSEHIHALRQLDGECKAGLGCDVRSI